MAGEEGVGYALGAFALDCLRPDPTSEVASGEMWTTYMAWCNRHRRVPLAYATFYLEFEKLAFAVGFSRRQVGAHVFYTGVKRMSS